MKVHQGDADLGFGLDGGVGVMSIDEQKKKRKQKGFCPTCGSVKTHKPGLFRSMMPDTIDGLVYKGICLRCNSLDSAKLQLCEPIDDIGISQRDNHPLSHPANHPANSFNHSRGVSDTAVSAPQASEKELGHSNLQSAVASTRALKKFESIYNKSTSLRSLKAPSFHRRNESQKSDVVLPPDDENKDKDSKEDLSKAQNIIDQKDGSHSKPLPSARHEDVKRHQISRMESDGVAVKAYDFKVTKKKEKVKEFRCSDANGDSGFYTGDVITLYEGTDEEETLPNGRGEMTYDDGKITKGMWTNGLIKLQVASEKERYKPYTLAHYSIGDVGKKQDMIHSSKDEIYTAVSKLHVGDGCFVRRSDGSWSYTLVKSRTNSSIIFVMNDRGSTKTVPEKKWKGHVRPPSMPDVLEQYTVGDPGLEEDMLIFSSREEASESTESLKTGDGAFVRRSDGSWAYSLVVDRLCEEGNEEVLKLQVNSRGSTKSVTLSKAHKFIRRVKHNGAGMSEESAQAIFQAMRFDEGRKL